MKLSLRETRSVDRLMTIAWKLSVFGVFLVRIFPYSGWIRRNAKYISVFSPNAGKYGLEKLRIGTLFTQCTGCVIHENIDIAGCKFDGLVYEVLVLALLQWSTGNIDILVVSEMKLDNSFPPVDQFLIDGNKLPFRLDGKTHGWGIMIFVKEDIPCKFLSVENQAMQSLSVEVNLIWKRKSLALFSSHC